MTLAHVLAKPIDRLAKYIETEEDDFGVDVELKEPHAVLQVINYSFGVGNVF